MSMKFNNVSNLIMSAYRAFPHDKARQIAVRSKNMNIDSFLARDIIQTWEIIRESQLKI